MNRVRRRIQGNLGWLGVIPLLGLTVPAGADADMEDARFAMHRKNKFESSKTIPNLCDNPATTTIEPNYSPNYQGFVCHQYTTNGPAPGGSQLYLVLGGAGDEGVGAVSFGIDYEGRLGMQNGVDPLFNSWFACANGTQFPSAGEFGDFPAPKGGLRISWASCQTRPKFGWCGVHVVIGSLYVYAYAEDVVRLTPNFNVEGGPELAVTDCSGVVTEFTEIYPDFFWEILGRVHLGGNGSGGYTPCRSPHEGYGCSLTPVTPATWGRLKTLYRPSAP